VNGIEAAAELAHRASRAQQALNEMGVGTRGMDLGVTWVGPHDELWILTDNGWYGMAGHRAHDQEVIEPVGWWGEPKRSELLARCARYAQ
jgi:hypothetical protein